ncbi:MAG: hypothetical protein Q7U47_10825 [Paludibacter sp.]|nr:hypothetical protein [Paludibacter sp.]
MKLLKIILLAFAVFVLNVNIYSQDNAATPEYEATKQTENLQQELNLSTEQVKQVYEINLKYARARQNSVSRSEAMERMKNKDADLQKVLNSEQINRLQNKRYERSNFQSVQPTNYRSPVESTNQQTVRRTVNKQDVRNESSRGAETMQTTNRATNRTTNQSDRRGIQGKNYQQTERSLTTPSRSTTPSPQVTTPSNPENNRGTRNSSGSNRR